LKKQGSSIEEAFKDAEPGELPTRDNDHHCPLNFKGSAKSMEAHAAVVLIMEVFKSGEDCLAHLVTDDDLRHPLKELVATGRMQKSDWPKTKGGANISNKGKLPLTVRAWTASLQTLPIKLRVLDGHYMPYCVKWEEN